MRITLPNGLVFEGTNEQIQDVFAKLGYKFIGDESYYVSESKGLILIKEMNTTHLRNAILKYYEQWVKDLHSIRNPKLLVEKIQNGIDDKSWMALIVDGGYTVKIVKKEVKGVFLKDDYFIVIVDSPELPEYKE